MSLWYAPAVSNLLLRWLIMSVAVWLTAMVVPGVKLRSFGVAIVVAAVYGVLNTLLGGIVWFLTFPLALLSFGIVVNAILLWITDKLLDDFEIQGVVPLVMAAIVLGVVNWGLGALIS